MSEPIVPPIVVHNIHLFQHYLMVTIIAQPPAVDYYFNHEITDKLMVSKRQHRADFGINYYSLVHNQRGIHWERPNQHNQP